MALLNLFAEARAPGVARRLRAALAAAAVLAACCPVPGLALHAGGAAESDLKAAFAYNFMVLSTWPADTVGALRFCVAGAGETRAFRVLAGKAVRGRTISVASVARPERAADCQVLYIPPDESRRIGAWLAAVAGRPTLTITDQADQAGAVVNLRKSGHQIVFDVDTRAASAARIQLSSQLLKLAASRK